MKPDGPLKMVGQLLDLPLVDSEGRWCGVVDDVELTGGAGKPAKLKALLVGPGAYSGRLPRWAMATVRRVGGDRLARVPMSAIKSIGAVVRLNRTAEALSLHLVEDRVRDWIPRKAAL